jgi:hypothetical protein
LLDLGYFLSLFSPLSSLLSSLDGSASTPYDLCTPMFQDDLVGKSECCSPFPSRSSSLYIIVYTDPLLYITNLNLLEKDFEKQRLRVRWDRLSGWLGNNTDCDYVLIFPVLRRRFQRILTTTLSPPPPPFLSLFHHESPPVDAVWSTADWP